MSKLLKNQKGISLMKLVIIIAIIIVAIIFIVKMSQPKDGLGTPEEEAEKLMDDVKKALEGDDIEKINSAKDALLTKANELATKVYEEAAKKAQAENKEEPSSEDTKEDKKDDVIDAEFEDK